jgi:flagellar biosynthesis component FlhA
MLDKLSQLPDKVSAEELKELFNSFLDYIEKEEQQDAMGISEALLELADKQWHTYKILDEVTKNRIEKWIFQNWNTSSADLVDVILSIIGYLGLEENYKMVKQELDKSIQPEVRKMIMDAIEEYGESVSDPYSGMK